MIMPLSFMIPLGILVTVLGAILFFATRYKKTAKVVMGVGLVISILAFILLVLALNSQM
jgi:glucose uptake protein GlcU